MAVQLQMAERVEVMGEACNEAGAPSCRVIARGSCCVVPASAQVGKCGWLAAAGGRATDAQRLDGGDGRPQLQAEQWGIWGSDSDGIARSSETVPEPPSSSLLPCRCLARQLACEHRTAAVSVLHESPRFGVPPSIPRAPWAVQSLAGT